MRFSTLSRGFALAASLGLCFGFAPIPASAAPWPQAKSDIPADPDVRFGTLPNGMKYAVSRNATPKDQVVLRLRFDAGSLQESDDQQGLAHFLEHMAFRGSKNVPPTEVWKGLQRLGMTSGADANASTNFTETIYKLDLPHNDPETIATGFTRMRDTASELTLDQAAMDAERGPILSEERLRDGPRYRAYKARTEFLFPNAPGIKRYPIGQVETIKAAPISLIRRFYDAFYRPERATFVVVGDIDPAAMEAKIIASFGDWKGIGPDGSDPATPPLPPRASHASVFSETGAPIFLTINWLGPYLPENSLAQQRFNVVEKLGLEILNRRIQALPPGAEHPFASAGTQVSHDFTAFTTRSLYFEIKPGDWKPTLDIAIRETRRIAQFGVTKEELEGVTTDFRAVIQAQAEQAGTRRSAAIANEIVQSVNDGEIYTSRAENLKELDDILATLSIAEINAGLHRIVHNDGPFVFLSTPQPVEGGVTAVETALSEAQARPVTEGETQGVKPWPYTDFGAPGIVAERRTITDLDTTFVRFANGVQLTVKPTKFQANQLSVTARIGSGRLSLPNDRTSAFWAIQRGALGDGGLKALTLEEMKRTLTGKFYGFDGGLQDDAMTIGGQTRPGDLGIQLQVIAAYLTAPGWRNSGFDSARTQQLNQIDQLASSPSGVFRRDLSSVLADGDKRWASPGREDVEATDIDAVKALVDPLLAKAPIELLIVGDVEIDPTIEAVAKTLGALPKREDRVAPDTAQLTVRFPAPREAPTVLTHAGRADQGIAMLAFPTTDLFSDVQRARNLRVLERVIQSRLTEQLRIEDGATYSPGSFLKTSDFFPGYGFLATYAELPPAKMPLFFNVALSIAADLRTKPVSDDELERAKRPRIVALKAAEQTNGFWLETLAGAQNDPRRLELIRTAITGVEHVSAADVLAVAKTYLDEGKALRLQIEPQPTVVK